MNYLIKSLISCFFITITFSSIAFADSYTMYVQVLNKTSTPITVKTEPLYQKGCFFNGNNYNQPIGPMIPADIEGGDEHAGTGTLIITCYNPEEYFANDNNLNLWFYQGKDINYNTDLNINVRIHYESLPRTFVTKVGDGNGNDAKAKLWVHNDKGDYPTIVLDPLS